MPALRVPLRGYCEGRGRSGTDCAGSLHTPDCDARDEGGPLTLARVCVTIRRG